MVSKKQFCKHLEIRIFVLLYQQMLMYSKIILTHLYLQGSLRFITFAWVFQQETKLDLEL